MEVYTNFNLDFEGMLTIADQNLKISTWGKARWKLWLQFYEKVVNYFIAYKNALQTLNVDSIPNFSTDQIVITVWDDAYDAADFTVADLIAKLKDLTIYDQFVNWFLSFYGTDGLIRGGNGTIVDEPPIVNPPVLSGDFQDIIDYLAEQFDKEVGMRCTACAGGEVVIPEPE